MPVSYWVGIVVGLWSTAYRGAISIHTDIAASARKVQVEHSMRIAGPYSAILYTLLHTIVSVYALVAST